MEFILQKPWIYFQVFLQHNSVFHNSINIVKEFSLQFNFLIVLQWKKEKIKEIENLVLEITRRYKYGPRSLHEKECKGSGYHS